MTDPTMPDDDVEDDVEAMTQDVVVMFHGGKDTITGVASCRVTPESVLWLYDSVGSAMAIYAPGAWNCALRAAEDHTEPPKAVTDCPTCGAAFRDAPRKIPPLNEVCEDEWHNVRSIHG